MSQLTNPKDVAAQAEAKTRLDLLEPAGDKATADALAFGGITKGYGIRNYIEAPISARVYIAAMRRHLTAWLQGEDCAPDSGVHHLGHVAANCHIALAAIEAGTFIDDRHGKGEGQDSSTKPPLCPDAPVCQACPAADDDDACLPHERAQAEDPHGGHVAHSIAEPCIRECPLYGQAVYTPLAASLVEELISGD